MQWIVYAMMMTIIFGCSWFSKNPEEIVDTPPPRIIQSIEARKPAKREPGSLWSEDSKWNEIFSIGSVRHPGDIIRVRVTEGLRSQIAQVVALKTGKQNVEILNGGFPIPSPDPKAAAERTPASKSGDKPSDKKSTSVATEAKAVEKGAEKAGEGKVRPSIDTKQFEVTILEVLPNGSYKIASNQGIKVGGMDEPYVSLVGTIREKEVATEDTITSDVIFDTKLDIVDLNAPNVIVSK